MKHPGKKFMEIAIKEAKKSSKRGQYALGSVIVKGNKVVSVAHTTLHESNDASAHAEMNAVRKACKKLNSKYLQNSWLYSTQEPCPMCASVAIWAKMNGIIFGSYEKDALKIYKKNSKRKFTWRQIKIPAKYVLKKGEPKLPCSS